MTQTDHDPDYPGPDDPDGPFAISSGLIFL